MNCRKLTAAAFAAGFAALHASAATPEVYDVVMAQDTGSHTVTITYKLDNAPAVVTLDVQTNCTDAAGTVAWASIGGGNIQYATGDVWTKVEGDDGATHTITWRPDLSWPDHKIADGGARAVVTAWAMENTPDYMVVDISAAAQPNTQKYYPAVEFLPGGILDNTAYRTTKLVMRKIMAKDVEWTMGSVAEAGREAAKEAPHTVSLTNNYYIGVFEVTQTQWALVATNSPNSCESYFTDTASKPMRAKECMAYSEIRQSYRNSSYSNANSCNCVDGYEWPNDPAPTSYLGLLRLKTGIDFDLPSEAQWEFAARAGNGEGKWGNGSAILLTSSYKATDTDSNLANQARYCYSGGWLDGATAAFDDEERGSIGATNGVAVVGSCAPNSWGLYDMHGNAREWCLDNYADNISSLGGMVNTTWSASGNTLRGGSWNDDATKCRSSYRHCEKRELRNRCNGFRLAAQAGLQ